ncbi:MAG: hypothetical protein JNJ65_05705 [Cyclobacteriaceae bacterium]|nr:hypothetical protein [Cyclobacteriaceae bacterium]
MSNFELIDDYLSNRLSEADRKTFEQQLQSDPALKADVEFQSQIIEGLKQARIAELKAMLNKVPVGGSSIQLTPLRIAAGLVGAAVLITAAYFYYRNNEQPLPKISTSLEDSIKIAEDQKPEPIESTPEQTEESKKEEVKPAVKKQESVKSEKPVPSKTQVAKPTIDVIDPSADLNESTPSKGTELTAKPAISPSKVDVDIDSTNKKYGFHYQFVKENVVLFGDFDKSLFEIIEINGEVHSLFLYYKQNYYRLDETQTEVTPLQVVTDKALIQLLREYRSK